MLSGGGVERLEGCTCKPGGSRRGLCRQWGGREERLYCIGVEKLLGLWSVALGLGCRWMLC